MSGAEGERMQVQLSVKDGQGSAGSLEGWMTWVTAELRDHAVLMKRLTGQLAQLGQEISEVKASLSGGALVAAGPADLADLADLKLRLADLDRRLNDMLALFDERFGAGQTEQGMLHHDHATDYLVLVEQKIVGLALDVLPGGEVRSGRDSASPAESSSLNDSASNDSASKDGAPRDGAPGDSAPKDSAPRNGGSPRDRAQFVAWVCRELFGEAEINEQRLVSLLPKGASESARLRMHAICEQARSLREKVTHGRPQRWEFGYVPGAPIDEQRQEPWPGSDPGGVVEFVVVPAYTVDTDTLLRRQRVFTVAVRPATPGNPSGQVAGSSG